MSALVTGVQTCALPISGADAGAVAERSAVELSGADRTDPGDSVFAAPSLSGVGVGVQPARQCPDRRRRRHRAAGGTEPAVPLSVLSADVVRGDCAGAGGTAADRQIGRAQV